MNKKKSLKIIFGTSSSKTDEIIYVREEDFEIPHGEDYKIAIEELDKIQNMIFDGKPFLEHFIYNDTSLWWFIYQSLISHYKKATNFTKKFSEFLDETKPTIVEVTDYKKLTIIKKICLQKNVKCVYSKGSNLKFSLKQKTKESIGRNRFEKITNEKTQNRINQFLKKSKNIPDINNSIIFAIPSIYRRQIFDPSTGVTKEGEYIQQPIMNLLNHNNIVGIDLDYNFKGDLEILSNRLSETIPWFPIEMFLNKKYTKDHSKFFDEYQKLISLSDFQKLFTFDGISLWDEIKEIFKEMTYAPHLPFCMNLIDSLSDYFKETRPKAFFLPYETGPLALSIIAACKNNGITTIGIQHGYIYEFNPMYSYGNSLENNKKYGFLLPDHLLLFGNYTKNLLLEKGYPSEKLVTLGNPAFFGLDKFLRSFNRAKILEKFGISPDQQIILFTSGKLQQKYLAHGKYDYDEQIWKYLVNQFGNDKKFFLILKPHPQEKDTGVYENILESDSCTNAVITHDSIYDLICLSDVVLSVFSTTMLDALCFQKPVIRVKFGNEKHHIFDNTNAIITSTLDFLSKHIDMILNNKNKIETINNDIQEFIKEQYGIPENQPELVLKEILNDD